MSHLTDALVNTANQEWEFFGRSSYNLDGTKHIGMKEYQDGAWQRVGDYWRELGGGYKNLTGKDRGTPWSAAFISFCMKEAGAANAFKYSAGHAIYINDAIRARNKNDAAALFRAHKKSEYVPQVGDLVGYWWGDKKITVDNALSIGWYNSHTDIVAEVGDRYIYVIGGNVGHSVTRKQLRTSAEGKLTDTTEPWFVVMQNQS